MELCLNSNQFYTLSPEELYLVEGGNWVKTTFGVVGGVLGGAAAFVGVTTAAAPVLTPVGSVIAGGIATPGGAAAGFAGGITLYDYIFK